MNLASRLAIAAALAGLLAGCSPPTASPDLLPETTAQGPAAPYRFDLQPADFVESVDNPYFPLLPGTRWVYEVQTQEGLERDVVEVLSETREVMGIPATVVHDTVTLDGVLIEDTYDWYAQDRQGNVWYLGEEVSNYEDGQFRDRAGSWEAGIDGALPGIMMFADPAEHIGETYRQEYYAGQAEDMADLESVSGSASVPYGSFEDLVVTLDYTPLEPEVQERKYYARGIGPVLILNLATGEEEVLAEFAAP